MSVTFQEKPAHTSGEMFADAFETSTANAPLVAANHRSTPRKIPGVSESPRRGFVVTDRVLVGGNLCARDMLGHLRYWLEPDEQGRPRSKRISDGHYWEICSLRFWQDQLGYSRGEVRNGVAALVASGAVVRETRRWGNNDYDHYRLVPEVAGIKLRECIGEAQCASTSTECASTSTPMPLKLQPEVTKEKTKTYKQAFPSGDAKPAHVKTNQEENTSENQTPKSDQVTPGAVEESPKKYKGKKPGPKLAPADMGSGDWSHYFELAKSHDMKELLEVCMATKFIPVGRSMLSDAECSMLERVEYQLKACCWSDDTLEDLLRALGRSKDERYEGANWDDFCYICEGVAEKDLHSPPRPNLPFVVKHVRKLLTITPDAPEPSSGSTVAVVSKTSLAVTQAAIAPVPRAYPALT